MLYPIELRGLGEVSRPISRVLSRTIIHLRYLLPNTCSDLPGITAGRRNDSLFGLAPSGVYPAISVTRNAVRSYRTISPLPQRGGIFSVALSVGLRRPGVTRHFALWSPDFPPTRKSAIVWPAQARIVRENAGETNFAKSARPCYIRLHLRKQEKRMTGWILLALLAVAVGFIVTIFNTLVRRRNDIDNAFAQIDVQLTRRYELIPNLVEIAKKYLQHERDTLTQVTAARNQAMNALQNAEQNPAAIGELARAEHLLGAKMGALYATFEAYPDLKADAQMRDLQEEIASTENRVAFARQHFNDSVTEYNNTRQQFPNNLIAALLRFEARAWLESEDIAQKREAVKVDFS